MKKTARQILFERRQKQLEYYHKTKDDPAKKAAKAERDRLRYLRKKQEKEQATS